VYFVTFSPLPDASATANMAMTYSELLYDDHNMLIQSQWTRQQRDFVSYLEKHAEAVGQIVSHHLSLRRHQTCKMTTRGDWLCGSFNICIPVHVKDQGGGDFLKEDGNAEKEAIFHAAYTELLDILRSEKKSRGSQYRIAFDPAQIIQDTLEKKSHWYFAAVSHPRNAYSYLVEYIQPMFAPSHADVPAAGTFQDTFVPYFAPNALELVKRKLEEKAKYDLDLRALVDAGAEPTK
jgi:hypothetical protein